MTQSAVAGHSLEDSNIPLAAADHTGYSGIHLALDVSGRKTHDSRLVTAVAAAAVADRRENPGIHLAVVAVVGDHRAYPGILPAAVSDRSSHSYRRAVAVVRKGLVGSRVCSGPAGEGMGIAGRANPREGAWRSLPVPERECRRGRMLRVSGMGSASAGRSMAVVVVDRGRCWAGREIAARVVGGSRRGVRCCCRRSRWRTWCCWCCDGDVDVSGRLEEVGGITYWGGALHLVPRG